MQCIYFRVPPLALLGEAFQRGGQCEFQSTFIHIVCIIVRIMTMYIVHFYHVDPLFYLYGLKEPVFDLLSSFGDRSKYVGL